MVAWSLVAAGAVAEASADKRPVIGGGRGATLLAGANQRPPPGKTCFPSATAATEHFLHPRTYLLTISPCAPPPLLSHGGSYGSSHRVIGTSGWDTDLCGQNRLTCTSHNSQTNGPKQNRRKLNKLSIFSHLKWSKWIKKQHFLNKA